MAPRSFRRDLGHRVGPEAHGKPGPTSAHCDIPQGTIDQQEAERRRAEANAALDDIIAKRAAEHAATGTEPPSPEDVAAKLNGLAGALVFVAQGCQDTGGPLLWDALRFLSDGLVDVSETVAALLQARGSGA